MRMYLLPGNNTFIKYFELVGCTIEIDDHRFQHVNT